MPGGAAVRGVADGLRAARGERDHLCDGHHRQPARVGPAGAAGVQRGVARAVGLRGAVLAVRAGSDIEKINDAAGQKPVAVQAETLSLLRRAQALSLRYPRQFALTIAPVTLAWNVNGEEPRVPDEDERAALCALVDDTDLVLNEADGTAFLRRAGQGLDLGGVAKGAACDAVRAIYEEYGVQGAVLDIGGNLLVYGERRTAPRSARAFATAGRAGNGAVLF